MQTTDLRDYTKYLSEQALELANQIEHIHNWINPVEDKRDSNSKDTLLAPKPEKEQDKELNDTVTENSNLLDSESDSAQ